MKIDSTVDYLLGILSSECNILVSRRVSHLQILPSSGRRKDCVKIQQPITRYILKYNNMKKNWIINIEKNHISNCYTYQLWCRPHSILSVPSIARKKNCADRRWFVSHDNLITKFLSLFWWSLHYYYCILSLIW